MTKPAFDPAKPLVMAAFKTVLGHDLPAGHAVTLSDEPSEPGQMDRALAERLYNGGLVIYEADLRPTPVETPEQEKARLAAEALRDAPADQVEPTADLLVWPEDDAETGKKAGQKVTKDDLIAIAGREGVIIETDDNKPDLIRKIMQHRANANANNSESGTRVADVLSSDHAATGRATPTQADTGLEGAG